MRAPKKNPYVFDPKTDKVEWRNPTPIAELERRAREYFGDDPVVRTQPIKHNYQGTDALMEWHKEKVKSTISETYKDADYATPIWRCENDWDRTKEYLGWIAMWVLTLTILYSFVVGFEKWVSL